MNETAQAIITGAIVLGAVGYLFLRVRKKSACGKGGGCDCAGRKRP
jgi:hypothetical protein